MFALTPDNLVDAPAFAIDFMKKIPTTWDETVFIDGYPGKYTVLARRHGNTWYVTGVNAQKEAVTLKLNLPMFAGQKMTMYNDNKNRESYMDSVIVGKKGEITVSIQPNGGIILTK
jgi:hypothetical protein